MIVVEYSSVQYDVVLFGVMVRAWFVFMAENLPLTQVNHLVWNFSWSWMSLLSHISANWDIKSKIYPPQHIFVLPRLLAGSYNQQ